MTLLKPFRRLTASQSGQLLVVGVGIAFLFVLMWLDKFEPGGERVARVLGVFALLGVVLFGYFYEWKTSAKQWTWREIISSRPLLVMLTATQIILLAIYLRSVWTDWMRPGQGADLRSGLMLGIVAVTLWRQAIRRDKRDRVSR